MAITHIFGRRVGTFLIWLKLFSIESEAPDQRSFHPLR